MKKKFFGALALARNVATLPNTIILTIGTIAISGGYFGLKSIVLFIANLACFAFIYAINDVEDAEDDFEDPKKRLRNPISNKSLTKQEGYIITFLYSAVSILFYTILSLNMHEMAILVFGLVGLIIGFLYSWKPVRFKSLPVFDVITHALMFGVVQYFAGYYAFNPVLSTPAIIFSVALFFISVHGDLDNENRDFEVDKKTNIKNTSQLIGNLKTARALQFVILTVALILAAFTLISLNLIINYYVWFLGTTALGILLLVILTKANKIKRNYVENIELLIQFSALGVIITYIISK